MQSWAYYFSAAFNHMAEENPGHYKKIMKNYESLPSSERQILMMKELEIDQEIKYAGCQLYFPDLKKDQPQNIEHYDYLYRFPVWEEIRQKAESFGLNSHLRAWLDDEKAVNIGLCLLTKNLQPLTLIIQHLEIA